MKQWPPVFVCLDHILLDLLHFSQQISGLCGSWIMIINCLSLEYVSELSIKHCRVKIVPSCLVWLEGFHQCLKSTSRQNFRAMRMVMITVNPGENHVYILHSSSCSCCLCQPWQVKIIRYIIIGGGVMRFLFSPCLAHHVVPLSNQKLLAIWWRSF